MNRKASYTQIAEYLSERIRKKIYLPGQKLPSINELSDKFHVHKNTVKKAFKTLNEKQLVKNHPGVGIIVRENLKYPLKLAIILPHGYNGLEDFISGMNEGFPEDYDVTMRIMFYRDCNEQIKYFKILEEEAFSGLIIRPDLSGDGQACLRKLQAKLPVVFIENYYQSPESYAVDAGAFDAASIAVKHLKAMRKLPVAVISSNDRFGEFFIEGFKQAHYDLREECRRSYIKSIEDSSTVGETAEQLMNMKIAPGSIICSNLLYASKVYKHLKEKGINFQYLQLLSFGDMLGFEVFENEIISIKRNRKELGLKAVNLLKKQLEEDAGEPEGNIETVNVELNI